MKYLKGLELLPLVVVAAAGALFWENQETVADQCASEEGDCIGTYLITEDDTIFRVAEETDIDSFYISVEDVRGYDRSFVRAAFPDDIEGQRDLRLRWCEQTPTPPTCG